MRTLWFIANPHSGTATAQKCAAIEAIFAEHGLTLAGRTAFPDEPLPDAAALDAAGADTVVLFAGDGTINAALCRLARWDGAILILPGGTMNLLAKALHDSLDVPTIIHAAHERGRRVALPYVEAGPHRAFVGLIVGPAGNWYRAREAARERRVGALLSAARSAWRRTFGRGVRIAGAPGLRRGYQAVFVTPEPDGLDVAGVDARDWGAIAELGWAWLTGDWVSARAVDHALARTLRILGSRPVRALFDGEPEMLEPGTVIQGGMGAKMLIATKAAA
ncbi:MAG: diacylglycerol kinase family protein [Sphingobium sp.]|uniref:diacylglycerol/lipid kinase family protein n=1 Tax=Sphingobium sp. TaxID=1912891 RepID=UPI002E2243AA